MSELGSFVKELRNIMRNDAGINGDAQRIEQIVWMLFLKVYDAKEENEWELEDDYVSIIPENCRWRNWAKNIDKGKKEKNKNSAMTGDELLNFVNNTLFPALKKLPVTAKTPPRQAIVRTMFEDANQYMKDGVLLRQMLNEIDDLDFSDYQESHAFGEIYESILKELQSAGSSGEFYTPRAVTDFMAQMIQPKIGEQMADFACGTGGFLVSWLKALEKIGFHNTDEQQKAYSSVYGIEKKQFPYMLAITNMLLHDVDEPNIFHDNSLLHPVLDYSEKDQFDVILMNPPYGGNEKEGIKKNFPDNLASSETADLFLSVIMYRLKQNGRAGVILPDGFLFGTDNAKIEIKKKLLNEFHLHTVIRMPQSVFSPYTSITTNILFFDRTGKTDAVWFYRLDMPEGYKHFSKTKPMKLEHFAPVVDWWENRSEIRDIKSDDAMTETWKSRKVPVQEIIENGYSLDFCGFPNEEKIILSPEETINRYVEKQRNLEEQLRIASDNFRKVLCGQEAQIYSIANLTNQLCGLNESFPQDMRDALLQAAMQGKLTEQLPSDSSVDDLLETIHKEKEQLIKEKKIKKEKPLKPISENEIPFDIPDSWRWVRWGDLSYSIQYGYNAPALQFGKIKMVRISDIQNNRVLWDTVPFCEISEDEIETYSLQENDILFARTGGTVGKSFLVSEVPEKSIYAGYLIRTRFNSVLVPQYFKYFMESPIYWTQLQNGTTKTAQPNCNGKTLSNMVVPLPPIEEQQRIVQTLEKMLVACEGL